MVDKFGNMYLDKNKNINRGFRKLVVWQESVDLYVFISKNLNATPYELKKPVANTLDSGMSIQRNIAEGYCRRSIKEYLNFLNYSLASSGELYSSMYSYYKAKQISENVFAEFDKLHYSVENKLINLIKSLQNKSRRNDWNTDFEK